LIDRTFKLEETLNHFMQVSLSNHKNTKATLHNSVVQIGQLAKKLDEKPKKNFGANTETNLKN